MNQEKLDFLNPCSSSLPCIIMFINGDVILSSNTTRLIKVLWVIKLLVNLNTNISSSCLYELTDFTQRFKNHKRATLFRLHGKILHVRILDSCWSVIQVLNEFICFHRSNFLSHFFIIDSQKFLSISSTLISFVKGNNIMPPYILSNIRDPRDDPFLSDFDLVTLSLLSLVNELYMSASIFSIWSIIIFKILNLHVHFVYGVL